MENWSIEGPRSALWVVRYLSDSGRGGPESYHKLWRMTCSLSLANWGVSEHMQMPLCRLLGRTISSISVSRVELIEYPYRERSREGLRASGLGTGASAAEAAVLGAKDADLFDGVGKNAGGACVAPAIIEFIASELEERATNDKRRRKAWRAWRSAGEAPNTRSSGGRPDHLWRGVALIPRLSILPLAWISVSDRHRAQASALA